MAKYIDIKVPSSLTDLRQKRSFNLGFYEPNFWVEKLGSATISPTGSVFKSGLVIPGSFPKSRQSRLRFVLHAYKQKLSLETGQFPIGVRYILGYNSYSYGNYYHWITEALPRFWVNKNHFTAEDAILLPDSGITGVARDSLSAIGFKRFELVKKDRMMHCQNMVLTRSNARQAEYHLSFRDMRDAILKSMGVQPFSATKGDLLYVSRGKASARSIANESLIVKQLLSQYSFKVIQLDSLSFQEQVLAFYNAKLVISIHGAALTNVLWMKPGSSVIELYKRLDTCLGNVHTPSGLPSLCYLRLASMMNLDYKLLQCCAEDESQPVNSVKLIVDFCALNELILNSLRRQYCDSMSCLSWQWFNT